MSYRQLYIWVEGVDDLRLFERIIRPFFETSFNRVQVRLSSHTKKEKFRQFLRSIRAMSADYLIVTDIDQVPCVTAKKHDVQQQLGYADADRIVVVVKEIESWYLAGLDDAACQDLGIQSFSSTDDITKEQFQRLVPQGYDGLTFKLEILNRFSKEVAKQKNRSFGYFLQKHLG